MLQRFQNTVLKFSGFCTIIVFGHLFLS